MRPLLQIGCMIMPLVTNSAAQAQEAEKKYDLSRDKVLYCVGYAHLDTQWRWDFQTTIDKYIRDTLEHNFERIEKYPGYVFNFTGSVRYEMMREYYPEHYARLKKYISDGRWHVSGSSVDEGDVNVPSAEAVIRQVLYGNQYFRREFGKESIDFMLPDCFGFPASMPSIWAHCGLRGFSTQKLTWGSAVGIPFKIGVWEGLDGRGVIAAFDPGPYVGAIEGRVDTNADWIARVQANGEKFGVWADYHYYGVGDQGGAPHEKDVQNYTECAARTDGPIRVALTSSDQMYRDITDAQMARLPRYKGDLLLTEHSAGTLTSQAYMKRWNRKNELLADAAERAAVAAHGLGGAKYPREKLYRSWVRLLANQMHDILPGTSIPRAYTYSWNDEIVAANGFAAVLTDSVGAIARGLNTQVDGIPLVVYNPLAIAREDLVEAEVAFEREVPPAVRVFDARGEEVPSQVLDRGERTLRVLFLADVESVGWTVFSVQPAREAYAGASGMRVDERSLESEHYRVRLNDAGDVVSIVDKAKGERELLAGPAQLVFTHEKPQHYPAWNMDWADRQKAPLGVVDGPARVTIVERGPLRVALRVERAARNSEIAQEIRLARGESGRRIVFKTKVDWQSTGCALRAAFPLTVKNAKATYNWEIGTIERGNNEPTKYEVPSHQWFDLTDEDGEYGVSMLEDCKYGSDKPDDHTLRLTLLYSPGVRSDYLDQHSQDWGRHEFVYALYGHEGDWRAGRSDWHGRRLNQPLWAFQVSLHDGDLGKKYSLLKTSTPQVDVRALKLAEEHDERIIIRAQELWGRSAQAVEIAMSAPIAEAVEVDGQERRIGAAEVRDGKLVFDLTAYSPRSFSVRLAPSSNRFKPPTCQAIELEFDTDVATSDSDRGDGAFAADGRSLPAEQLQEEIVSEGIVFRLASAKPGKPNAVACRGQSVELPAGDFNRLYLLAAAAEDTEGKFQIEDQTHPVSVPSWTGFVGQWDDRVWDRTFDEVDFRGEGKVTGIKPGYVKRETIAWFSTHRHHPKLGNEAYQFSYLFKLELPLAPDARALKLPNDPAIRILAATLANNPNAQVRPAQALYDDFVDREPIQIRHVYPPPPQPVFLGLEPLAVIDTERQEGFDALKMGPPTAQDYVDRAAGNTIVFRYFSRDGEFAPHRRAGAVEGTLPRLNDGEAAEHDDDTQRCVWYDCEGRFHVDLLRNVEIARINTYSWHRADRAPQHFSLWGSSAEEMPAPDFERGGHGAWSLIAVVDTRELGPGGVHGSSIRSAEGSLGPFRYLLWIAEDHGQGTFFTEIDVHAAP